ncbi:MAG: leucine-rich repeat domain-containing protein, partial [Cyanobacteria bacterium J06559_3]
MKTMKRAIALGLLTVLLVISVGCFGTLQGETSPNSSFETFTDWCRHRDSLTPEVQHTVEKLLEEAETQECDRAQ